LLGDLGDLGDLRAEGAEGAAFFDFFEAKRDRRDGAFRRAFFFAAFFRAAISHGPGGLQ
jgi:hypothetical protein